MTLLALAFASAGATGATDVSPKPHVGAIELAAAISVDAHGLASAEERLGNWDAATTETSDVSHAARGGAEAAAQVAAGEARAGQTVYRVWGGGSRAWGSSRTRVDPRTVANFRNVAGLPGANTGQYVSVGRLVGTEGVQVRGALSLEGNIGGLDELLIPNAESQVELQFVGGANPGF